MINIAVCDDRREQLELVHIAVERYFQTKTSRAVEISDFNDPAVFLASLEKNGSCDIAILDICMPGIAGTEVGRMIRRRYDNTEIIFVTTSDEFAVDAFALNAAHYIIKPFTQEQFNPAMDRAMARFTEKEPKKLLLQTENGAVQTVDAETIMYIESVQYSRYIHTSETVYTELRRSLISLRDELEQLMPGRFFTPYRGYIVNMGTIKTITTDCIVLQNGERIPIKSSNFRNIRDEFFAWSFGKGIK